MESYQGYPRIEEEQRERSAVNERSRLLNVNTEEIYVEEIAPECHTVEEAANYDKKVYYEVLFVVMPLFCGYACLFALQRSVKQIYHIGDDNSGESHLFGLAASLVYIGNFVFRLGHNVLFWFAYPRTRVLISMGSMCLSMILITLLFFVIPKPHLFWVFIAYALGGVGIGTFESNLLSTIAPLGKRTKLWAIVGMPVGINLITVGGFCLLEVGVNPGFIFLGCSVFIGVGVGLFLFRIYREAGTGNYVTLQNFFLQFAEWRHWLPQIKWHSMALLVDMFCVSMFSPGVMLYIYDGKDIVFPWFGHSRLARDWMFAIYDACFFLGDTLSRKVFYQVRVVLPFFFWLFAFIGVAAGLSNVPELMPICGFLVAFCNGSIYSQANRMIDGKVDKKYSLIAFSFWLFIGDIGSVIGSNTISYVSVAVKKAYHHH